MSIFQAVFSFSSMFKFKSNLLIGIICAISVIGVLALLHLKYGVVKDAAEDWVLVPGTDFSESLAEDRVISQASTVPDQNEELIEAVNFIRSLAMGGDFESDKEAFVAVNAAVLGGRLDVARDLAFLYERGIGVERDHAEALKYYLMAAEAGDAHSMMKVARYFERGHAQGLEKNYLFAMDWYELAAEGGELDALVLLGQMHAAGRGVESDLEVAFEYYSMAADGGSAKGQFNKGLAIVEGWGTEKNLEEGVGHIMKAAEAGDPDALFAMYKLLSDKSNGLARGKDHGESLDWLKRAAGAGHRKAIESLVSLEQTTSDSVGKIELAEMLQLGRERGGSADAAYQLGQLLRSSDKTRSGRSQAKTIISDASSMGSWRASFDMAFLVASQMRLGKDVGFLEHGSPRELIERAASQGDHKSKLLLKIADREGVSMIDLLDLPVLEASMSELYKRATHSAIAAQGLEGSLPKIVHTEHPVIPDGLALQGYVGEVVVRAEVGPDGSVLEARAVSSEHQELSEVAVSSILNWKFEPIGKKTIIKVPIVFR